MRASVLAALLAVGLLTVAVPAADASSVRVIQLHSVLTGGWFDDQGKKGASPGDHVFEQDDLRNAVAQLGKPKGALVGSDMARLTLLDGRVELFGVARFGGGTITVRGRYAVDKQFRPVDAKGKRLPRVVIPVVRGTGTWAHARGTVTIVSRPVAKDTYVNIFRIVLPTTA